MNRSAPHIDVRVLCNDDYDAVIRLVSELDADERYRRFLTRYPTYIGEWALSLTTPSDRGCALGAFESGDLQGVANYVDTSEDGCAEVAIVVAHEQHHRGIGTGAAPRARAPGTKQRYAVLCCRRTGRKPCRP